MEKQSTTNNRKKKAERRELKNQRKSSNKKEELKNSPNNLLLGLLIFGIIVLMFAVGHGIKYFQKEATLESYIEKNKDMYESTVMDEYTTLNISAKKNRMNMELVINSDDEAYIKEATDYYTGEDGTKNLKYSIAYYLVPIKEETRALYSDGQMKVIVNDKEVASASITCFDADRLMNGTYYNDDEEIEAENPETEDGNVIKLDSDDINNAAEDGTVIDLDGDNSSGDKNE